MSAMVGERRILHLKQPGFPRFHFEWHEHEKKVFVVDLEGPAGTKIGHCISANADTQNSATALVLAWLQGFMKGTGITPTTNIIAA